MTSSVFESVLVVASAASGAIASVVGFGIGSILTPLLALSSGAKKAVVLVSIPHFAASLARFVVLRKHANRRILLGFGVMNAAGALAGAILHGFGSSPALSFLLAALLLFAGAGGLLGYSARLRFGGAASWTAGAISGVFGGLVGNQGGIRSAAMLGLRVEREAFVATATAIALMVDVVRTPVYLIRGSVPLGANRAVLVELTVGVLLGTLLGAQILRRIPERLFRQIVGAILCTMAILLIFQQRAD